MECPTCQRQALRVADEKNGEAAWYACPDGSCRQPAWQDKGRRGRPGEPSPLVDALVSKNAEELERAASWTGRTAT
jgi:hypothetical protein